MKYLKSGILKTEFLKMLTDQSPVFFWLVNIPLEKQYSFNRFFPSVLLSILDSVAPEVKFYFHQQSTFQTKH